MINISGKKLKSPMSPKELLKPLRRRHERKQKAADEAALREKFKGRLPKR